MIENVLVVCEKGERWQDGKCREYRIRPNFRGAQFSRIVLSKHFAETIFADQGF